MTTVMIFHDVDDVDHWLGSPKRKELFGPAGITIRTFVDPERTNRVGVLAEVPDVDAFQELLASDAAAAAMKFDGVHPDTIMMRVES